jgi:23S rRNA (adenine2503-C2)-methyltransferase
VTDLTLLEMLPEDVLRLDPGLSLADARRIVALAQRHGALPEITPVGLRRGPYLAARAAAAVARLRVVLRQASRVDPFVKLALGAPDGAVVEAVQIPLEHEGRVAVCVSSQVGCGLGCRFCGTGQLGLSRNLRAWEIVEQVRAVRESLPGSKRVHSVLFQGMGEPLANLRAVVRAVRVLTLPSSVSVSARNVTICTVGIASALPELLRELPLVRVGLSIGSALPATRRALCPIEDRHPLAECVQILAGHARATRTAPMLAYTLLAGVNDDERELAAFLELLHGFVERAGMPPRVSLIRYNPVDEGCPFAPASDERLQAFRAAIGAIGVPVVRRYSGGADILAACGQLGRALRLDGAQPG